MLRLLLSCVAIPMLSAALAAPVPKYRARPAEADAQEVLESFLGALADNDPERAYSHVAPDIKKKGDPTASGTKFDYDSFLAEVQKRPVTKFGAFKFGKRRNVSETEVRIFVHFEDGDNDETLLVKEDGRWFVADPVHIIR